MMAFGRPGEQVDGIIIVELIDLQPAPLRRQAPSEPINENLLSVMMHLHERRGEAEATFRKYQIDHLYPSSPCCIGVPPLVWDPGNYRVRARAGPA
jgi:hypothetical protein